MGSFKIWFLKPKRQAENEVGEISRLERLQTYRKTGNGIFFQVAVWDMAALGKFLTPSNLSQIISGTGTGQNDNYSYFERHLDLF